MAEEEKKKWYERAWDWRTKNIRDPIRETKIGGGIGEVYDKTLGQYMPGREGLESFQDMWKHRDERKNWKDAGRILGNYLDWEKDILGGTLRSIPRYFGYDMEFYNPMKHSAVKGGDRKTIIPGIDFKGKDESRAGVGALGYTGSALSEFINPGGYENTLSLANPKSVASKFLNQYDSIEAFQGYINDNMTEKDNKKIIGEIGKKLDWNTWRQKYKYNDPQDFVNLQTKMYEQKIIDNYLDPYMKGVGEKYKERMLSEFGAYDIQNKGYFKNLGFTEPLEISSRTGEPFLVDKDWVDDLYDDDPKNDQNYPDEFNFGMMDPLYEALFQREDPFKYDQPEHYEHIAPNIVAGLTTGFGTARTAQNLVSRAPAPVRLGLGTLFPFWSQQGMRFPKNWKMVGGKELGPTTRSLAQVGLLPLISEKHKQKRLYPEE